MSPPFNSLPSDPLSNLFTGEERRTLLQIARRAIEEAIIHGRRWHPESLPEKLAAPRGAFVTLMLRGRLRGCVGMAEARDSLAQTVARCAVAAATEDNRFKPLDPSEVTGLAIEISVLSPLAPIKPVEIEIGRHGLVIERGAHRGLLLPQVPVEHRWTREDFLSETCVKAGLAGDAWESPETRLLGFTADVFSEDQDS
jgi:AmmeMemoRadiSam system protein A